MTRFERKKNFVDSGVQGGLVMRIMGHWLCFFGITAFLFIALKSMLGDPDIEFSKRVADASTEFMLLAMVILAILPAFVLDTIRFSNRFVGPVTRMRRALRELGEHGTTEKVQFRDNDFWQEIASDINRVTERLKSGRESESSAESLV